MVCVQISLFHLQEVVVLSLLELPRYVALDQLTPALGGVLHHSPRKWVGAHQVSKNQNEVPFGCPTVLTLGTHRASLQNGAGTLPLPA